MIKRPNLFSSAVVRLLLISLAVLIPLNLLTIMLSRTVQQEVEKEISLETQNALNLYMNQADSAMSRIITMMNRFMRENVDYLALSDKQSGSVRTDEQWQHVVSLRHEIRKKLEDHSMIDGALFFFPDKELVTLDGSTANWQAIQVREILLEQIGQTEQQEKRGWQMHTLDGSAYLTNILKYRNGYCGLWIDLKSLTESFSLRGDSDRKIYCMTDGNGTICNGEIHGQEQLDLSRTSMLLSGKSYAQVVSRSVQADFCLVELLSQSEIYRLLPATTRALSVLSFAALILIPVLMLAIQRLVIAPVNRLLDAMEHVDNGDLEYRIDTARKHGSEFDALNRHFNHTMDEVRDLKISVYEEKLKTQKIHLRFLSQQIRPHFILNTLNILYSYEKEDFPLIQRMILCLSRYFRYVVNANEDYVLLGQETEHIRNYFEIQQARFLRTFRSEVECDESLYSCMIPPLLIQSFAENSIKYALRPGEIIRIAVRAETAEGGCLHISVTDDGVGIPEETLAKIRRFTEKREYQRDLGVGIQNAIDRMDLLYNGEGSIRISRNEPQGTRVDIWMPILRKEEPDDECDFD